MTLCHIYAERVVSYDTAHALCLLNILSTVRQTRFTWSLFVWEPVSDSLFQKFERQYAVLLDIYTGSWTTKISECLGCLAQDGVEDSKRVGWVQWGWQGYGSSGASLWSIWWEKNSRIFGNILAMIDNNPSQSIRFRSQRQGSVWVPYLTGSSWRHLLFILQNKKEPIFITDLKIYF